MVNRISSLNHQTRSQLIAESVRYCQRVARMGMLSCCYSKALREPVYFLWHKKPKASKVGSAGFRSKNAAGLRFGRREFVFDHAIPFNYLLSEFLKLEEVTYDSVEGLLSRFDIVVLITKEEDDRLNSGGYRSRMPDDWDEKDPFARYKAVGIEIVDNKTDSV